MYVTLKYNDKPVEQYLNMYAFNDKTLIYNFIDGYVPYDFFVFLGWSLLFFQMMSAGCVDKSELPDFDQESGLLPKETCEEEDIEIELVEDEPPFLQGHGRNLHDLSPVSICLLSHLKSWKSWIIFYLPLMHNIYITLLFICIEN